MSSLKHQPGQEVERRALTGEMFVTRFVHLVGRMSVSLCSWDLGRCRCSCGERPSCLWKAGAAVSLQNKGAGSSEPASVPLFA